MHGLTQVSVASITKVLSGHFPVCPPEAAGADVGYSPLLFSPVQYLTTIFPRDLFWIRYETSVLV